ncbi:tryptophan-rich sensory protein [Qipengyuania sp. 1NDW9]|uniref:Tryptophan-rich sensory protein n=1 Tax=Qipengyuania xiapuensis TaxID=2867236 RepID=A0ABX8ZTQ7_9SPHN|nr:TspO/MBR family protein [Qipengyuania xiapuensis]MBX7493487.1 tryptophan-rich sensory protein [Qipengyuania xiapuensis]QZD92393.1 tryptophan-rich sensory protein [Qipengyuania xiapuensis]
MNTLASRGQLRASFLRWALFLVPLCVLLGFLSGMVGPGPGSAWFQALDKPAIYPEPKWFGIVWTILYVMIGLATAMVASAWGARGRGAALTVFALHFLLNLAWTPIFFGMQQLTLALGVLVAIVLSLLVVIVLYWRVRRLAAVLLLPYLAWVCFATLLNYEFLRLNPDADGGSSGEAVERVRIGN